MAGLVAFSVVSLDLLFYIFLIWWRPANEIERAMDLEWKHLGVSQDEVDMHAFADDVAEKEGQEF